VPLVGLGLALEMDIKSGTEPTVAAQLLMPLRHDAENILAENSLVELLQRLLAYVPTERPTALEAGEWVGGGGRGSECADGSAGGQDMVQDMAALCAALLAQPIEPISYSAERVGYDMFLAYRVQSESTLANELYDKCFVVAAQHPDWHFSQVQSMLHIVLHTVHYTNHTIQYHTPY
jgi:hypothetical protein